MSADTSAERYLARSAAALARLHALQADADELRVKLARVEAEAARVRAEVDALIIKGAAR